MIVAHRTAIRLRWRKLLAQQQALLVLANLRNGDTLRRVGAGWR